jgi:transcriptional repressor AefR-like protein
VSSDALRYQLESVERRIELPLEGDLSDPTELVYYVFPDPLRPEEVNRWVRPRETRSERQSRTQLGREIVVCELSDEGWALQRLMFDEAARFPDLFEEALAVGGGRVRNALAGRLARLGAQFFCTSCSRHLLRLRCPEQIGGARWALRSQWTLSKPATGGGMCNCVTV